MLLFVEEALRIIELSSSFLVTDALSVLFVAMTTAIIYLLPGCNWRMKMCGKTKGR